MSKYTYIALIILCPLFICSQNVEVQGGLITDSINVNGGSVRNLAAPVSDLDAATKKYVDEQIAIALLPFVNQHPLQVFINTGNTPLEIINLGYLPDQLIGVVYQGGYVFYVESDGTGLIALTGDINSGTQWGCSGTSITGADSYAIGGGNQNTVDIEAGCGSVGTAADLCANLDFAGYSDWFLPSDGELYEMYLKIGPGATFPFQDIGSFTTSNYWSSTEFVSNAAVGRSFSNGSQSYQGKNNSNKVRPIRAF